MAAAQTLDSKGGNKDDDFQTGTMFDVLNITELNCKVVKQFNSMQSLKAMNVQYTPSKNFRN